jgi:RNA polymerase sigma-70 factor, ECF subfamily
MIAIHHTAFRAGLGAERASGGGSEAIRGERADLGEELQLALGRLRDEYRTCFVLFHQQELSCAEIGEIMGCPTGTVKTWLHRARGELAEHLQRRGVAPYASCELQRV